MNTYHLRTLGLLALGFGAMELVKKTWGQDTAQIVLYSFAAFVAIVTLTAKRAVLFKKGKSK